VLYQAWCFLALQRHLGVDRPTLPAATTRSRLHIELAEGTAAAVVTPSGWLWHERSFAAAGHVRHPAATRASRKRIGGRRYLTIGQEQDRTAR
jgi:hypothetical protein